MSSGGGGCCGGKKSNNQGAQDKLGGAGGLNVKGNSGSEPFRQQYKPQGNNQNIMGQSSGFQSSNN